jgi:hypothetical protein
MARIYLSERPPRIKVSGAGAGPGDCDPYLVAVECPPSTLAGSGRQSVAPSVGPLLAAINISLIPVPSSTGHEGLYDAKYSIEEEGVWNGHLSSKEGLFKISRR